jgi:hypothetical protein
MSRRSNRNRHRRVVSGEVVKAVQPSMPGTVAVPVAALLQALTANTAGQVPVDVEPLPRPQGWATLPFAPGVPVEPRPINAPDEYTGRPAPRRYDFPVSYNLPGADSRILPWKVLRDAADNVDLIRRCIEVRKAELRGYEWDIVVSERALEQARRDNPGLTDVELGRDLRDDLSDEIARLRDWWEMPDRTNGLDFNSWVSQALEEHLVLDALAIWPRRTRGGDLFSLEVLDGTTIKPLLDERGNTPAPPFPAYQQVILGFPRGEFTADAVADGDELVIEGGMLRDELIYERWNVRTHSPYGFSVVEQALVDADLWLKRQAWIRAEYTDGVMPAGWIETDTSYTPEQLRAYNAVFNDYLSGNTRERQRVQTLPKGFKPLESKQSEERYRPHFDEFLLKLVTSHFGVLPSRLGFTPNSGLGGKGHQEGEEDSQEKLSTRPTTEWLAGLFTRISRQMLGMPAELCFQFLNVDGDDEAVQDETNDKRVRSGRLTLNESRDKVGEPRYDFPEADMPMIVTTNGVIFLNGEQARQQQAQETEQAIAGESVAGSTVSVPGDAEGSGGKGPTGNGPEKGSADKKPSESSSGSNSASKDAAKADEVAALRRFARKGARSRPFVVKHLTVEEVDALGLDVAVEIAKDGGASREALAGMGRGGRGRVPARPGDRAGFTWAGH